MVYLFVKLLELLIHRLCSTKCAVDDHSKGVAHKHRRLCHQSISDLVCVICNTFLVFDLIVLVLACLNNNSLTYPCMHLKVKSRILN